MVGAALVLPTIHGKRNTAVKQSTIHTTICVKGWTATIRPTREYTHSLKVKQLAQLGYLDQNPAHYEEDHLIPLELGGSPMSPNNLWPEPWSQADNSDPYENSLRVLVCDNKITLHHARTLIIQYKAING